VVEATALTLTLSRGERELEQPSPATREMGLA
jgi:hypothetical protein